MKKFEFRKIYLALALVLIVAGCKTWDNFTTYFNSYYNMDRLVRESEDEFEYQDENRRVMPRVFSPQPDLPIEIDPGDGLPEFCKEFIIDKKKRRPVEVKLDSVLEKGSKILTIHPNSVYIDETLYLMALAYFYKNEWLPSQIKCSELIDKDLYSDMTPDAYLLLSKNLLIQRKFHSGKIALSKTVEIAWFKERYDILSEAFRIQAELALYENDLEGALKPYKQAIAQSGDGELRARWQLDMAALLFRMRKFERAMYEFAKVRDYSPDYVTEYESYLYQAECLTRLGECEKSEEIIEDIESDGKYEEWVSYAFAQRMLISQSKKMELVREKLKLEKSRVYLRQVPEASKSDSAEVESQTQFAPATSEYTTTITLPSNTLGSSTLSSSTPSSTITDPSRSFSSSTISIADDEGSSSTQTSVWTVKTEAKPVVVDGTTADVNLDSLKRAKIEASFAEEESSEIEPDDGSVPDSIYMPAEYFAALDSTASGTISEDMRIAIVDKRIAELDLEIGAKNAELDKAEKFADSAYVGSNAVIAIYFQMGIDYFNSYDYMNAKKYFALARSMRSPVLSIAEKLFALLTEWESKRDYALPELAAYNSSSTMTTQRLGNLAQSLFQLGRTHEKLGNIDSARFYFKTSAKVAPMQDPKSAKYIYAYSRSMKEIDPWVADSLLELLVANFPLTDYGQDAMNQLGYTDAFVIDTVADLFSSGERLRRFGEYRFAIKQFLKVYELFPKSEYAPRALYSTGWIYERRLDIIDSALYYYKLLVNEYPKSEYAADVRLSVAYMEALASGEPLPDSLKERKLVEYVPNMQVFDVQAPDSTRAKQFDGKMDFKLDSESLINDPMKTFENIKNSLFSPAEEIENIEAPELPTNPEDLLGGEDKDGGDEKDSGSDDSDGDGEKKKDGDPLDFKIPDPFDLLKKVIGDDDDDENSESEDDGDSGDSGEKKKDDKPKDNKKPKDEKPDSGGDKPKKEKPAPPDEKDALPDSSKVK